VSTGQFDCPYCWNAGLPTRDTMLGGGGEVKVVSIGTPGQPDAGWLAAT